jgi:hypothetical protein
MKGSDRKVVFQGVHQLMGSDLGPKWAAGRRPKGSKMVFIGIDLPKDVLLQGLETSATPGGKDALAAPEAWLQSARFEGSPGPALQAGCADHKASHSVYDGVLS